MAARYNWHFPGPPEVTGLPDAQLDQPGQSVLRHHPSLSVLIVVGALLQRPGLLQRGFLGKDQHPPFPPAFGPDALGPQWTYSTHRPVEPESLPGMDRPAASVRLPAGTIRWVTCPAGQMQLPRQVDDEVILGETLPVRPAWHSGHRCTSRIGKSLVGAAVAVGSSHPWPPPPSLQRWLRSPPPVPTCPDCRGHCPAARPQQ